MKPPRKRFKSEKAILKAIDATHAESRDCFERASQLHALADALLIQSARMGDEKLADGAAKRAVELRKEAKQFEASGTRLVESKAKRLGEALATFKTELLFGEDRSVPV